ncbi:uncharacterized protein RSE6_03550 [Rhynchosporium secalis]|uniref:Uncharacterized protein n=1 Tax=Rhynchosporium secalis TaxID=38038 RepID=A0A1E1M316_RHYSE|nr:uncharacterized protein RSE6_03550 [Rhynchosporium secalis]
MSCNFLHFLTSMFWSLLPSKQSNPTWNISPSSRLYFTLIIHHPSTKFTLLRLLDMNSNNHAVGALVLVPIVIAASAAFIAIYASEFCKRAGRYIKNSWNKNYPWSEINQSTRRRKLRKSNIRSSQLYADSWADLESIDSREGYSNFIDQKPSSHRRSFAEKDKDDAFGDTAKKIWHPSRSARLAWSFANPRSPSRNLFESSSVARPSPTARRPERLSAEDAALLAGHARKRQGRGSVIAMNMEEQEFGIGSGSSPPDLIRRNSDTGVTDDDLDLTPKARPNSARTASAGAFVKSELYQRSVDIAATSFSVRDNRHPMFTPSPSGRRPRSPNKGTPPKIPERRPSKSKNFFLRAIGGRSSVESKSIRRKDSQASKGTLIRRLSRSKHSSSTESYTDSIASTDSTHSFKPGSLDITDMGLNPGIFSYEGNPPTASIPNVLAPDVFVLCPQIVITPEIPSVDTGLCFLWVAIEITGTLRKADGFEANYDAASLTGSHVPDLEAHGRLHSMRIDLHPGQGCLVSEIIGDLHNSKTIRAGETQLILAKVRFSKFVPHTHLRESSSDGLIAQLENDLGDTLTTYLTVRLTYKHSAFASIKRPAAVSDGMSMHITRIQTEATGSIKRHNPLSAWSPRSSQTLCSPAQISPLINLVETFLPSELALEVIRKLAGERTPISLAKRFETIHGSSEETVKPASSDHVAPLGPVVPSPLVQTASARGVMAPPHRTGSPSPFARFNTSRSIKASSIEEMDPARRIWTEMRRHSRGNSISRSRHPRGSISADHYYNVDESPNRTSSINTTVSAFSMDKCGDLSDIKEERGRIMDIALKNKRSVGQETLKSIVPSVGRQKGGGALSSLGLGVGRTWGWNGNWW